MARLARGVQRAPLVDDVLVPSHVPQVLPPPRLDERREPVRGDRVRHDGRPGVLREHDRGQKRDQAVAIKRDAGAVNHRAAVDVRVKDDAEVGAARLRRARRARHRLGVLGVGRVVRERPVRVQELRAVDVRAERLQHLRREESAGAVPGVDGDFEPAQRAGIGGADAVHDERAELFRVLGQERRVLHDVHSRGAVVAKRGDGVPPGRRRALLGGGGADGSNVRLVQASVLGEKFGSVAVERQVRRGEHHRGVVVGARRDRAHEARGGRGEPQVHDARAPRVREPRERRVGERGAGEPRVAADGDDDILRLFAHLLRQPLRERLRDEERRLLVQGHGLTLDAIEGHTAHVRAVLELAERLGRGGGHERVLGAHRAHARSDAAGTATGARGG
mmetsp:Transcript_8758/g.36695  ORF Transcript_8758/g.36695 Transcript_8758/m.36695 type:complete len:391 (-) Transcript_8758:423-1595(-)